jgi:cell wall-associated NlpC family hydrolase
MCVLPASAFGQTAGGTTTPNGGTSPSDPTFAPAPKGKIVNGIAIPPIGAPPEVVAAINSANEIARKPYIYGGGHRSFVSRGYDCSGSVSYALHGAGLVTTPLDSSDFMSWGVAGAGKWITVYTNPAHAFVVIAGMRFDTGFRDRLSKAHGAAPGSGPRWGGPRAPRGYRARHAFGL